MSATRSLRLVLSRTGRLIGLLMVLSHNGCEAPPATSDGTRLFPARGIVVNESDSASIVVVTISGSVSTLPEWSLSDTPVVEISGNAPPYITRVGEVAFLGEDRLLVEDRLSSAVHSFGTDGAPLRVLAQSGDGPGEVRAVTQLSVTQGDTAYAFDAHPYRISAFGPDGSFVNSFQVDPSVTGNGTQVRDAWALGADRFLLLGRRFAVWPPPSGYVHLGVEDGVLQVVSADGTQLVPPVLFPGNPYVVIDGPRTTLSPLLHRPFVAVNHGRILRGLGRTYELVLLDHDLRPVRIIRWDGWSAPLAPTMLEDLRDSLEMSLSVPRRDARLQAAAEQRLDAIFHADALPEVMPALNSALMDEAGSIWVAAFKPALDLRERSSGNTLLRWSQEDMWHVLDADGTPIGQLRLPPRTRLLAVRSDRVAVVTRGDFDLEHVRVFMLIRGDGTPVN